MMSPCRLKIKVHIDELTLQLPPYTYFSTLRHRKLAPHHVSLGWLARSSSTPKTSASVMTPRPIHVIERVESGDTAPAAFLRLSTLRCLAQDLLLVMNIVMILLYLYYSLIGLLAMKLRGLVEGVT